LASDRERVFTDDLEYRLTRILVILGPLSESVNRLGITPRSHQRGAPAARQGALAIRDRPLLSPIIRRLVLRMVPGRRRFGRRRRSASAGSNRGRTYWDVPARRAQPVVPDRPSGIRPTIVGLTPLPSVDLSPVGRCPSPRSQAGHRGSRRGRDNQRREFARHSYR
jgi:hypothetical protein